MSKNNSKFPGYLRPTFSSNMAAQVGRKIAREARKNMWSQRNASLLPQTLSPPQEKKTPLG